MYSTYRTWLLITRTLGWPHRGNGNWRPGGNRSAAVPPRTWWGRRAAQAGRGGWRRGRDCFTKSRSGINPFYVLIMRQP